MASSWCQALPGLAWEMGRGSGVCGDWVWSGVVVASGDLVIWSTLFVLFLVSRLWDVL